MERQINNTVDVKEVWREDMNWIHLAQVKSIRMLE
jgi:hypothetical protein